MSQDADARPLLGTLELAWNLRLLIPYLVLSSMAIGISAPGAIYPGLNFFAQRHTGLDPREIHCEASMAAPYCQEAVLDQARMAMLQSIIFPVAQFVVMPVVGALSDTWGRRYVLLACHAFSMLQFFTTLSFLYFNTSMYWYYVVAALTTNPVTSASVCTVVAYAIVMDLVEHQPSRSVGLGLVEALCALAQFVGNAIGSCFAVRGAMIASCLVSGLSLVFLALCMPETLPPAQRKPSVSLRSLVPGVEMRILWRSAVLARLTLIIILTGFVDLGLSRVVPMAVQRHMPWTARDSYFTSLLGNASMIVSLGLLFRPLSARLGDVGLLGLGRCALTVQVVCVIFSRRPWEVMFLTLLCTGPIAFSLPAISGLKSTLVAQEEQGTMQAALNTAYAVAGSAGVLFFSCIFDVTNRAPGAGLGQLVFILGTVMSVLVLLLICSVPAYLKQPSAGMLLGKVTDTSGEVKPASEDGHSPKNYGSVA